MQEQSDPLLKVTTMKSMMSDGRDCRVRWRIDFGKMEIHIHVDFIAPMALISFLNMLWNSDERLEKVGIKGVLQTCRRFTIKLWVTHEAQEVCYRLSVCKSELGSQMDIELTPIPG